MRTGQHESNEMLEQTKTSSKTPVGPTKDRASSTNQHYPKLNFNNHACSLSYNIYVVPNLLISKNDFMKSGTEVIVSIYFSGFIY